MIYQTVPFNPTTAISKAKQQGYRVNTATIAADIRHNHTNYDAFTYLLDTDQAEEFIMKVYTTVVTINPVVKPAMVAWVQKKMKGLI